MKLKQELNEVLDAIAQTMEAIKGLNDIDDIIAEMEDLVEDLALSTNDEIKKLVENLTGDSDGRLSN